MTDREIRESKDLFGNPRQEIFVDGKKVGEMREEKRLGGPVQVERDLRGRKVTETTRERSWGEDVDRTRDAKTGKLVSETRHRKELLGDGIQETRAPDGSLLNTARYEKDWVWGRVKRIKASIGEQNRPTEPAGSSEKLTDVPPPPIVTPYTPSRRNHAATLAWVLFCGAALLLARVVVMRFGRPPAADQAMTSGPNNRELPVCKDAVRAFYLKEDPVIELYAHTACQSAALLAPANEHVVSLRVETISQEPDAWIQFLYPEGGASPRFHDGDVQVRLNSFPTFRVVGVGKKKITYIPGVTGSK